MIILEFVDRALTRLNEKVSVPVVTTPGTLSSVLLATDACALPTCPPNGGVSLCADAEVMMPPAAVIACTEYFPAAIAEPILHLPVPVRIRFVDVAGNSPSPIVHVNVVVEAPGEAGGHTAGAPLSVAVQVPVVAAVLM